MPDGDIKDTAGKAVTGRLTQNAQSHLISGLVMTFGFLLGFLPIYTGFLDRLGGYDKHFGVIDDKIDHIEREIGAIQADVRAGNVDTRSRLDQVIATLGATRELILSRQQPGK